MYKTIKVILIASFCMMLGSLIGNTVMERKLAKKQITEKPVPTQTVLKSKVVEIQPDYSKMPSYCNPMSYTIVKIRKEYFIRLSGGTYMSSSFKTAEEAQEEINSTAKHSYDRWIKTGGEDF